MDPKERQQLEEETYKTYGKQIDALKDPGEVLCFVVNDKEIRNLSDRFGLFGLRENKGLFGPAGQNCQKNTLCATLICLSE